MCIRDRAGLAAMLPYAEDQCSYGVELDVTVSSSVLTRTGNMTLARVRSTGYQSFRGQLYHFEGSARQGHGQGRSRWKDLDEAAWRRGA